MPDKCGSLKIEININDDQCTLVSETVCNIFCDLSTAKISDTHKLWRHLEPRLKTALQTVYLHEVSGLLSSDYSVFVDFISHVKSFRSIFFNNFRLQNPVI